MISWNRQSSRTDRWSILESILQTWFGIDEFQGYTTLELDAAGSRLGIPLPQSLREWYGGYGQLESAWQPQDYLLAPERWSVADGVLTFCVENQSVVSWGVDLRSKETQDPPVLLRQCRSEKWTDESNSVSLFAVQFALMNVKFSPIITSSANGEANNRTISAVERRFPQLPVPDLTWSASPTKFYGDSRTLIETNGERWIWVTCKDTEALEEVDQLLSKLGMDWTQIESGP